MAKKRATALLNAAAARRRKGTIAFTGYDVAKGDLYARQHGKCAYCERQAGVDGQPVEHFRPKAEAWRGDPWSRAKNIDRDRYWWLAWTWDNLLFACATCNCPNRKGNWFPLARGSKPLRLPGKGTPRASSSCFDVTRESPLLVDPAVDDPLDHIAWRPLDPSEPVEDMEWRPVHKTERGRYTICVLGLDRGIADQVGDHIRRVVHPRITGLTTLAVATARKTWDAAVRDLLCPTQPYLAATHDAIDFFVPSAVRRRLGLTLPRP